MRPVIQRSVAALDEAEVRRYYDLRIREIGNPTNAKHRNALADILRQAVSTEAAKGAIRQYISNWNAGIAFEAGPPDPPRGPRQLPAPRQPLAPLGNKPYKSLGSGRGAPVLDKKKLAHFSFGEYNALNIRGRLQVLAQVCETIAPTTYERLTPLIPGGEDGLYYRFHKFSADEASYQMVFGGGINKSEIDFPKNSVMGQLNNRSKYLKGLSDKKGTHKARLIESFQAGALNTPFIATTADFRYTVELANDPTYKAKEGQLGVILVIKGPKSRVFDFESEFETLGAGRPEDNYRTRTNRAKDANQREYGIGDLFIPMHGRSRSGFEVIAVIYV